jgi:hypothetical protein
MNSEMTMTMVRQGLLILGTLATTLGWLSPEKVASLTANVLALAGPIMVVATTAYGIWKKTQTNIIATAATQTDANGVKLVKSVDVNPLAQGAAQIVRDTPANVNIAPPQAAVSGVSGL